jgi:hypothetical protein
MATSDMLYRMSPDWAEMLAFDGRGFLSDTTTPDSNWLQRYIPEGERVRVTALIEPRSLRKVCSNWSIG